MTEWVQDLIMLGVVAAGLLLTVFRYIENRQCILIYAALFYLTNLLSQYYWTAYEIVTGDSPGISSAFAYFGWNIAFVVLLMMVRILQTKEERRYFSPVMLLPVPAAIYQFSLYIPFGGVLNSAYQCLVMTLIAMVSLQSILWYRKNRKKERDRSSIPVPYVHFVTFFYSVFEFGMWTSSCFDYPTEAADPYQYFMYLSDVTLLLLPFALRKRFPYDKRGAGTDRYRHILKGSYVICVSVCCIAGVLLGVWMRGKIETGIEGTQPGNLFDLIAVMLFVISLVIVAFTIALLLVLDFRERAAENEALRKNKEFAEHVSQAKSEFLANMSHEIRTPINAVLGMNQMILRANDLGETKAYARNLESAGKNLLAIINDILDFSKIESGKLDIRQAPYQLSSVLNDSCNMILFRARDKGLSFQTDVDNGVPDGLIGDEVRVRQIITNLLSNALKYTDTGGITLRVEQKPSVHNDLELVVSVRDTGIGIREEDIGKLFTQFERADEVQDSATEGTGLGLAITKHLLDLMNGEIHVESVYGEGSLFTAIIPQGICDPATIGDFRKRFMENTGDIKTYHETFRAPEACVLAVDDSRMNLNVIEELLKQTQMRLDTAESGAEALVKTKDMRYDLILMDQRMPGMDGVETLKRIRAQEEGCNRETPVICLTADAVQGARERYLAEGFTDYISKPVDAVYLEEILMKHLPPEKIMRITEEAETVEADITVREIYDCIDDLCFEDAVKYVPSEKKLKKRLEMFYETLEKSADTLEELYRQGDYENYAVKAHALKSAARMIGATKLSELARELEENSDRVNMAEADGTAWEDAIRFVQEKTPELLTAMRTLAASLKPKERKPHGIS